MRIDSSGNVGINTNSPSTFGKVAIQVTGTTSPTTAANVGPASINLYNGGSGGSTDSTTGIFSWNAGDPGIGSGIGFTRESSGDWGTQIRFYTHPTTTSNIGNITERMRIDSSGNFLVGTTTVGNYSTGFAIGDTTTSATYARIGHNLTGAAYAYMLFGHGSADIGSIAQNSGGTAVTYNTSSDYRLKNSIAPMTGALAKVALLKPCTYKWNADGSDGQGFIAHELAEVVPDCVTGEKDAIDADGKPQYQGIDVSFLVATLTAAIQEQQAIIESLKARLDAANL